MRLQPQDPGSGAPRRLAPGRIALAAAVLGLAAAGSFAWGFAAHRNQIFPYELAHGAARALGLLESPGGFEDEATAELDSALAGIPYVSGTFDPRADRSGVVHHVRGRSSPGWNLFSPRYRAEAYLVSTEGRLGHRWRGESGAWMHVEPLPGGELLALDQEHHLSRLDVDSRVAWRWEAGVHHDLSVDGEGRIHVLVQEPALRPEIHPEIETLVDHVAVLSPGGEPLSRLSLLDALQRSPYAFLLPDVSAGRLAGDLEAIDLLHANHVEVFDGRLAGLSPLFAEGNYLVSMRTISAVLIVDPRRGEVVWAWGPSNLVFPHYPTLLDDGRLLIFNNGLERSEIVELDPLSLRVTWRYRAPDFFTRTRGSVQRLPNGNTLITESDSGYAFEVTREGERVWTFANPVFTAPDVRMPMWRMLRLAPDDPRLPPGLEEL